MTLRVSTFCFFAVYSLLFFASESFAEEDKDRSDRRVKVITPDLEIKKAKPVALDDEMFEVGTFFGGIAIEGFSIKPLVGTSLVFHWDDRFFTQVMYGASDSERATAEDINDETRLSDEDRVYSYFSARAGINVFTSRTYFLKDYKFNSRIYFVAGVGSTSFCWTR